MFSLIQHGTCTVDFQDGINSPTRGFRSAALSPAGVRTSCPRLVPRAESRRKGFRARVSTLLLVCIVVATLPCVGFSEAVPEPDAAREVFQLLNDFRAQNSLPALRWDERLSKAALDHAYLCARNRELSHQYSGEPTLTLRPAKWNIRLSRAGENLAMDVSAKGAHAALKVSPPHRASMLNPNFNAVGIAAVRSKDSLYVVEDFAHLLPETTVAEFEQNIASEFDLLRANSNVSKLRHSASEEMRKRACEMARDDSVSAGRAGGIGARYVVAFTISEPRNLPANLTQLRNNRELSSYEIGACFAQSRTYPNGVYWVVVALYSRTGLKGRSE